MSAGILGALLFPFGQDSGSGGQDSAVQSAQRRQEQQVKKLERQQKEEASQKEETRIRNIARDRQRRRSASARGARSTILTGPLGVGQQGGQSQLKSLTGQ